MWLDFARGRGGTYSPKSNAAMNKLADLSQKLDVSGSDPGCASLLKGARVVFSSGLKVSGGESVPRVLQAMEADIAGVESVVQTPGVERIKLLEQKDLVAQLHGNLEKLQVR